MRFSREPEEAKCINPSELDFTYSIKCLKVSFPIQMFTFLNGNFLSLKA